MGRILNLSNPQDKKINMQIKVFHLRLNKEHLPSDEAILNDFLSNVKVKRTATQFISEPVNFWSIMVFYEQLSNDKIEKEIEITEQELNNRELELLNMFKQWRIEKARELAIPAYTICHDKELLRIIKVNPKSKEELIKVKGFRERKIDKYGDEIVAILNSM